MELKKKISLLYGGKSAEHGVSVETAFSVAQALDREKYEIDPIYIMKNGSWVQGPPILEEINEPKQLIFDPTDRVSPIPSLLFSMEGRGPEEPDVIFPLLHGPNGEDGTVQGFLELLNIPYVGSGVMSSAVAMDKAMMKQVFSAKGFPQADYLFFKSKQWEEDPESLYQQVKEQLGFPCFVKPANLGSSVGISKCEQAGALEPAFRKAFQYDQKVIIEEYVEGRELEIGVLGNDDPEVSVVGEILPGAEFYDYQAKYEEGHTSLVIPADLSEETYEQMKTLSIQAVQALDCAGLARVDFFFRKSDQAVLINEVNTMPGFTPHSMFPSLWKQSGVSYPALVDRLLDLAVERYKERQSISFSIS